MTIRSSGDRRPVPLERGRAAGTLSGLLAFTAGFAAAGILGVAGYGGGPAWSVAVFVGLAGVGAAGFFLHRGNVELPQGPVWSPRVLRVIVEALDLPAMPVVAVLYVFAAIGVLGNIAVPLSRR